MQTVYLIDATLVRSIDDGAQNIIEGPIELRLTTEALGIFGGDGNPLNDDLEFTVRNNATGETLLTDEAEFLRIGFNFGGAFSEAVIVFIEVVDEFGFPEEIDFFTVVEGSFPDLPVGTNLNPLIETPGAIFDQTPAGYGPGDFIEFADFAGIRALGATSGGITTEGARTVAYLYEANFNRVPDLDGLNFWIDAREGVLPGQTAPLSELEVSQLFLDSPEFAAQFGDPDALGDRVFVETLYQFVLDRPGDDAGIDFWTGLAEGGRDRAQLLLDFVESNENADALEYVLGLNESAPGSWEFL